MCPASCGKLHEEASRSAEEVIVHHLACLRKVCLQDYRAQDGISTDDAVAWAHITGSEVQTGHVMTTQSKLHRLKPAHKSAQLLSIMLVSEGEDQPDLSKPLHLIPLCVRTPASTKVYEPRGHNRSCWPRPPRARSTRGSWRSACRGPRRRLGRRGLRGRRMIGP